MATVGKTVTQPTSDSVGLVSHEAYLVHDAGPGHPESADRLRAIHAELSRRGLDEATRPVSPREASLEDLILIHRPEYVEEVEKQCRLGRRYLDALDTGICRDSYRVALLAAGGALAAVDEVVAGRLRAAFAAVRPPGHHAEVDRAMGFCLFNNVAVAARHAQSMHGVGRVLICDFDVHHGNGTQHVFESDPTVFYMSIHQFPFYPGTGASEEIGVGPGRGFTMNVPLPAGSGDAEFVAAIDRLQERMADFRPDLVLVSAGFDAHAGDPLASMEVTEQGYRRMTRTLRAIANDHAQGRIVSLLEGGYNLRNLGLAVAAHVEELLVT